MAVIIGRKPGGSGGGGGGPTGPAGGDLSGTYANPAVATVDDDVLGSGTPDATTFLRGDRSWQPLPAGDTVLYDSGALGSAQASIDTNPTSLAGHTHLEVWVRARSSAGSGAVTIAMLVNNVTTNSYYIDNQFTGSAATSLYLFGNVPISTSTAGTFGVYTIKIPFYTNANYCPNMYAYGGTAVFGVADYEVGSHGCLLVQGAVTRLSVAVSSGNVDVGSRMIVYGRS